MENHFTVLRNSVRLADGLKESEKDVLVSTWGTRAQENDVLRVEEFDVCDQLVALVEIFVVDAEFYQFVTDTRINPYWLFAKATWRE